MKRFHRVSFLKSYGESTRNRLFSKREEQNAEEDGEHEEAHGCESYALNEDIAMVLCKRALAEAQRIEHIYISMLNTSLVQANGECEECTVVHGYESEESDDSEDTEEKIRNPNTEIRNKEEIRI